MKMTIIPNTIYRFNVIPIKLSCLETQEFAEAWQ